MTTAVATLSRAAEDAWLEAFVRGPQELTTPQSPQVGDPAPDAVLLDEHQDGQRLSSLWEAQPALLVFWRHFGCSCGLDRAARLRQEHGSLASAGVNVVIIAMGEPARAAEYRREQRLPCPVLSDPEQDVYRRYGLVEWQPEHVLYDAPSEFLRHERETGASFLANRREQGRPPVDNPWRQTGEFLVDPGGRIRMAYRYQYCEDYPDPRLLAAFVSSSTA